MTRPPMGMAAIRASERRDVLLMCHRQMLAEAVVALDLIATGRAMVTPDGTVASPRMIAQLAMLQINIDALTDMQADIARLEAEEAAA